MKFDELDKKLRKYETSNDLCVLPGIHMVARIDGRNFTRLTRQRHKFEAPFDEVFRDHMVETTRHLLDCGFRVIYGYTQSDEISLLFHPAEQSFSRKLRKYNSVLAGEASAKFSVLLGDLASFDCRICQLPTEALVVDYFRWRNEDAHRNALNGYCYWTLREQGVGAKQATDRLHGMSVPQKNELLFKERDLNFNDVPNWQKRGVGLLWREFQKPAQNPVTGEKVMATRRRIELDLDLPMRDAYSDYIRDILAAC